MTRSREGGDGRQVREEWFVTSTDGMRIAVQESGNPDGPVLVAVHGYPDDHQVWDPLAAELAEEFRVITYDVRGAGRSDKPRGRKAYRISQLTEDFGAVLDDVSPDAPVHLLAHDWGSIQSWGPVTDPRFAQRIASFTSISGPNLDYVGVWLRDASHLGDSARQLAHSWYISLFQIPVLPERLVGAGLIARVIARTESVGAAQPVHRSAVRLGEAESINGIQLYRANFLPRLFRPRPQRTAVPVQVLAPLDDAFASIPVVTQAPIPYVANLSVAQIPGTHWVVRTNPALIADRVRRFAAAHTPPTPKRARR